MSGAGLAFGRSEYQREADAYLQQRLKSIYVFAFASTLLFLVLDLGSNYLVGGDKPDWPKNPTRWVHVAGVLTENKRLLVFGQQCPGRTKRTRPLAIRVAQLHGSCRSRRLSHTPSNRGR